MTSLSIIVLYLGGFMKKSNAWEDEEVKTLFKFVEIKKRVVTFQTEKN